MRKLLVLLCALGLAGALYATDPFSGTWKLNLAKSKYEPGPAPKEKLITVVEGKTLTDVRNGNRRKRETFRHTYDASDRRGPG